MNSRVFYILMVFLTALPLTSIAEQNSENTSTTNKQPIPIKLTPEENNWLREHPVIKVGNETDWPPFDFTEDGKAQGYSIGLLQLASKKVGLDLEFVTGPTWSQLVEKLRHNELDILPAVAKTKQRSEFMSFTSPYLSSAVVLVTRYDENSIKKLSDLQHKHLAIVSGYYYEEQLKSQQPLIKILPVNGFLEGLEAVLDKKADAFIGLRSVVDTTVRSNLLSGLKIAARTGTSDIDRFTFRMAISKQNPLLASIIDKALKAVTLSEKQILFDQWISFNLLPESNIEVATLNDAERKFIQEHPVIRVSSETDWPPINFIDNNLPSGFSIEYIKLIAAKSNLKLEFVQGQWDELLQHAYNKDLDVLLNTVQNNERSEKLLFTKAYANTPMAIFSKTENASQKSIDDLTGKRVAIVKDAHIQPYLEQHYPTIKLLLVNSTEQGIKAVSTGSADAMLDRLAVGNYVIIYNLITNVSATGTTGIAQLDKANWHLAVRSDWPELVSILEKGMDLVSQNEFNTLVHKWYLYGASIIPPVVDLNEEERMWLKKHPLIRVASEPDYHPFDFRINDQPTGYSVDYINLLAERLGIRIEYVKDTWDNLLIKAKNKELDLIHSLFNQPTSREDYLNFTKPYKDTLSAIIIRKNSNLGEISDLQSLARLNIAVVKGDSLVKLLTEKLPSAKQVVFENYEEALTAVAFGHVDATITELPVAAYYIRTLTLSNLKMVAEAENVAGDNQHYRLAVRKDWPELIPILEKAMDTLTARELKQLDDRWISLPDESKMQPLLLNRKEKSWLAKHSVLSLAYDINWSPIEFADHKGRFSGISSDFIAHIEKLLNVDIIPLEKRSWTEMLQAVSKGEADIVSAISPTPERRKYLRFTSSYLDIPMVIVTHEKAPFIAGINELKGKKVTVVSDYYSEEMLIKDYPSIELIPVKNVKAGLLAVNQKQAFAFIGSLSAISHIIGQTGLKQIKVSGETPYQFNLSIGTIKGEPILAGIMQKALDAIPQQERSAIFRKWFSVTYEHKTNYTLIIQIILGAAVLLLISLWWNRKLRTLNQQLVSARNEANIARMTADQANQAKSRFLANMSHELRTPLNAILGFSQILLSNPHHSSNNVQNLEIINRSGNHLLHLINDVLDMSKIEAGRIELETNDFDLKHLIQDVTDIVRVRAESKGLQLSLVLHPQLPRCIHGDQGKLRQIFINLLSNAIKFTEQGQVTLRLEASLDQQHKLILKGEVEDTGPGILAKNTNDIFKPFEQFNTPQKHEGTGLGLAITQKFITMMGGNITVRNTLDGGALFLFYVYTQPARKQATTINNPITQEVISLKPGQAECRVLIAEDHQDNQLLLKQLLELVGFSVKVANNGEQALKTYKIWQPHFIWMDRRMPIMGGLETTQKIRALPNGDKVIISILTASAFKDQEGEAFSSGANSVLYKPYKREEILNIMAQHLDLKYIYKEKTGRHEEKTRQKLSEKAFDDLTEELRRPLYNALVELDIEQLNNLTIKISQHDKALAAMIQTDIDSLDLSSLEKILSAYYR